MKIQTECELRTAIDNFLETILDTIINSQPLRATAAIEEFTGCVRLFIGKLSGEQTQTRRDLGIPFTQFRQIYDRQQLECISSREDMLCHDLLFVALKTLGVTPPQYATLVSHRNGGYPYNPPLPRDALLALQEKVAAFYGQDSPQDIAVQRAYGSRHSKILLNRLRTSIMPLVFSFTSSIGFPLHE